MKNIGKNQKKKVKRIDVIATYIFYSLISFGIICTLGNSIYYKYLFKNNGAIIEAKLTNSFFRPRGFFGVYEREYTYHYGGITYKRWQKVHAKENYIVGECVQIIISKDHPKISKIYSEHSYKCED